MRADRIFLGCRVAGKGGVVGIAILAGLPGGPEKKIRVEWSNGQTTTYFPSAEIPVVGDPDLAADPRATSGQHGLGRKRLIMIGRLIQRDGDACFYCGEQLMEQWLYTLDHLIPKSKGGRTMLSNFVLACAPCNQSKGDKSWVEFAKIKPGPWMERAEAMAGWWGPMRQIV